MPVYWASSAGIITSAGSGITTELAVCKLAMTWLGADPSALSNVTTITNNSSKEDTLCNVVYDSARKAVLEDYNWQFAKRHLMLNPADGYYQSPSNNSSDAIVPISGITNADPAVVTTTNNHGFSNGWLVKISGVTGMDQINGRTVRCANSNATTFECYGLNSTAFSSYVSSGNAVRFEAYSDYHNGYAFDVPADFLRPVHVEGRPQYELVGSGNSQRILCTEQFPVVEYIADVTVVAEMSEGFKRAWAARIAAELANPLQKKNAAMPDMWGWYQQVLERESKPSDSKNVDPKHLIRERSNVLRDGGWE
jgi:hypothetical protein